MAPAGIMLKEVIQDSWGGWEKKVEKDELAVWFIALKGKWELNFSQLI